MNSEKKPFGHSPSVLIVHDERPKGFDNASRCLARLGFAVAAEHIHQFVLHDLFNRFSCRSEILTRIEVRRIESKVLADCRGDCKSEVGVDVDLADCHRCRFAEHIFGNALCAGHTAAVLIDLCDEVLRNGRRAVQNNGESGQTFADFFEDVETKLRLTFELVCAVGSADCDCQRIDAGLADEFFDLVGIGELSVFCGNVDGVFDTCEFAEFSLDDYAVIVSVLDDLLCD